MNCANHPETPAVAFCQFCGKPLCAECVHKVGATVSCEPCLAARVQSAPAGAYGHYTATGPLPPVGVEPPPSWGTQPWLAFLLGWIPGVGAMYNGQFAKALAHVIIFAVLVDLAHFNGVLGLLVAGWIFYQVFDAYQTAVARRDGLPLPNPLGLNDIAHWFGARTTGTYPSSNPWFTGGGYPNGTNQDAGSMPPGTTASVPGAGGGAVGENAPGFEAAPGFTSPYAAPPVTPAAPNPADPLGQMGQSWERRGVPTGAVVLIGLGVLFLLRNLGILSEHWWGRGWPILLIIFGIWLAIQRSHRMPPGGVR